MLEGTMAASWTIAPIQPRPALRVKPRALPEPEDPTTRPRLRFGTSSRFVRFAHRCAPLKIRRKIVDVDVDVELDGDGDGDVALNGRR
jgi:hypothetical protein